MAVNFCPTEALSPSTAFHFLPLPFLTTGKINNMHSGLFLEWFMSFSNDVPSTCCKPTFHLHVQLCTRLQSIYFVRFDLVEVLENSASPDFYNCTPVLFLMVKLDFIAYIKFVELHVFFFFTMILGSVLSKSFVARALQLHTN